MPVYFTDGTCINHSFDYMEEHVAIQYQSSKYAFVTEGEELTEQEHLDSCDINKMVKNAMRGMQVRGGSNPIYGYDDITMDGLQHRILKQQLEQELGDLSEGEFDQETLDQIGPEIVKKFGFKLKKTLDSEKKQNDDQTTKKTNTESDVKPTTETV